LTNDDAPLHVRYIAKIDDPNTMDSLFREALATDMAYELCEEITQSNQKKMALLEDKKGVIAEAKLRNAIENVAQQPPDDDWITKRL
jgi:hypothetical protein